jgi:RNA recognition motif-containing protein
MTTFENLMKLYVGNLSFSTSESALRDLFSAHGTVTGVHIVTANEARLKNDDRAGGTFQRRYR